MDGYAVIRPWLFRLDPERAHHLTLTGLRWAERSGVLSAALGPAVHDPIELWGLHFPNRVGLAAGLDKDGHCIDGLAALGFGFVEIGTVTPRPQPGNPRPRLFRIPEARAIVNRMGFNNHGVAQLIANVRASRYRGILGINLGKNFDTPLERAADDYLEGLRQVYAHASYVTVNISSPNTKDLRKLQGTHELDGLLAALKSEQKQLAEQHARYVPLLIKIAPDLSEAELDGIAELLPAHGIDGVIATNTTLSRDGVTGLNHADEAGGLSGAPLTERSTAVVRHLAQRLHGRLPIIAAGGVLSGHDAVAKLHAGASLVQIYSGLIYRGPHLIREAADALRRAR